MQLSLIDPRSHPFVTAAMHDDLHLKSAIRFVRACASGRPIEIEDAPFAWPYVECLGEIGGRQTWLVDDDGTRYVVVRCVVFLEADLQIASEPVRTAARPLDRTGSP